jgi:hypothetical protein
MDKATTLALPAVDGTKRHFELPILWAIEAMEHAELGSEYGSDRQRVVVRAAADAVLVTSDGNGVAVTMPAERLPQQPARLKSARDEPEAAFNAHPTARVTRVWGRF